MRSMIDIRSEKTLSLTQACKLETMPSRREGKRPNVSTLWRWSMQGIRGVRLETLMAGGVRVTSQEAIQRFFDRLTEQSETGRVATAPEPRRLPAHRRKAIEAAEKKLAKAGI
jgi:hypothetical protein